MRWDGRAEVSRRALGSDHINLLKRRAASGGRSMKNLTPGAEPPRDIRLKPVLENIYAVAAEKIGIR
jgi:hypothetical protein